MTTCDRCQKNEYSVLDPACLRFEFDGVLHRLCPECREDLDNVLWLFLDMRLIVEPRSEEELQS